MNKKIIGIGFNKTGTTTLREIFNILNIKPYCPIDRKLSEYYYNGEENKIYDYAKKYKCFADYPWFFPDVYKKMDKYYKESQFILTIRKEEKWFDSIVRFYGNSTSIFKGNIKTGQKGVNKDAMQKYHLQMFGNDAPTITEAKEKYIKVYNNHNDNIKKYFKNKKNKLLIMDFEEGDGWEKICDFLECTIPNISFPHKNKSQ